MAHVKFAGRSYVTEMLIAVGLYIVALFARKYLLANTGPEFDVAIKLLPVVPLWLLALVLYRHYRRIDEYARLRFLETLTVAGGITALFAVTYQFLEDVGAPALDLSWAWPIFGLSWCAMSFVMEWRACRT